MEPSVDHLMRFFTYEHLPGHLADVSRPFWVLARQLVDMGLEGPELTASLRKLLESKDCAVRSALVSRVTLREIHDMSGDETRWDEVS